MRAPAVSFAKRFAAALMAALLTFALLPANALAEGEGDAGASAGEVQDASSNQADEAAGASSRRVVAESQGRGAPDVLPDLGSTSAASSAEAGTLAASLMGRPASFVNADVALDGEPVIGSFTVDGLTFAVTEDSSVELVGVSEAAGATLIPASSEAEADGPASEASTSIFILPETVAYNGVEYAVTSIGAYAFYLSGVTSVELPASVTDVDDRAFRSSDVASVEVAGDNPNYSSFDGALYDADQLSLLLIPEGKQGTVLLPSTAESASPSVFSHCSLVTQVSVEEGSAAFASENGLLYDASLTTLLRVPAGATDITIREGCTTIAAGAMEACASLATINASASVASISPDVFTSVPTVSLPASALVEDAPQLSAMVAFSSIEDGLPEVDPSSIVVEVTEEVEPSWKSFGVQVAKQSERVVAAATPSFSMTINPNGGVLTNSNPSSETKSTLKLTGYFNWAVRMGGITSYRAATQTGTYYFRINATRPGYTFTAWSVTYDGKTQVVNQDGQTISGTTAMTATPSWKANTYAVEYRDRADTTTFSTDNGFVYDTSRNLAAKPTSGLSVGYTAVGWATSKNQSSADYGFGTSQKNLATSGTKQLFLAEQPNTYTISFSANGGSGSVPSDIAATYDQSYQVTAPALSRTGYSFDGWATSEAGQKAHEKGGPFKNLTSTANGKVTLYAHWSPNTYTVTFDAAGGTAASDISATYDQELTLPASTRQGYAFAGWKDEATGTTYQAGKIKNLTAASNATVKLVAQWDPVIAAEVPLDVTAKVDLLGIEEQQQAQAHIKSLCGEPLRVACIELAPLPGGRELFGDEVSQVSLEAYAGADAVPVFSLTIGGTTFLSGGESLLALKMEGYGDEVPISYRFDIPDELLPSLVEATKPVCQVAYTVGRA